jgi:predicted MFS family arabinose efflux permease
MILQNPALHPAVIALIAFLTVVDLFAAQALLPSLVVLYGTTPATMGIAVNACTLGMAIGGLIVALYGQSFDRRISVAGCLALLTLPTLGLAFAPNLIVFSTLRILQGLLMSAAFGLTLAHIGESTSREKLATAFAAYITGNVASNLGGRLLAAAVVDHASVAASFATFSVLNFCGAILAFTVIRGTATTSEQSRLNISSRLAPLFRSRPLRNAFGIGFVILFVFIGVFTYINFVLVRAPLKLGMMQLGIVYFVFLPAIVTTPLAGVLAQRVGTRAAIWAGLGTAFIGLPLLSFGQIGAVVSGMVLVGVGTFFAQAVVTGYVSRVTGNERAAATGTYLAAYFTGGIVGAAVIGKIFDEFGWNWCLGALGLAICIAVRLAAELYEQPLTGKPPRGLPVRQ